MKSPGSNLGSLPPKNEEKALYSFYLEKIKNGNCKVQELNDAFEHRLIDLKQHDSLVSRYAERLENIEKRIGIDPLTKLLNRTHLKSKFNWAIGQLNMDKEKRKSPIEMIVVLYFDVTEFKKLNDTYGHAVGDKALITFADSLKKVTRTDDLLFRVGGDEFMAILLIKDSSLILENTFENKKKGIKDDLVVEVDGGKVRFKISMGVEVLRKGDNRTLEQITSAADKKMYEDKNNDKNSQE